MTAKIIEDAAYRERVFVFRDRLHAGRLLSEKLREYVDKGKVMLLALPAGGVPVGYVVAKELGIPMDVMVIRKIQIPWNTEAGFGALTWDGETVLNESLVEQLRLTREEIEESISKTRRIIRERLSKFRGDKPMPDLKDKVVITRGRRVGLGLYHAGGSKIREKGNARKNSRCRADSFYGRYQTAGARSR